MVSRNVSNNFTVSDSSVYLHKVTIGKGKGKAIPLQAWTGPEDSRKMRLPDFNSIGTRK
jgi:hypothetical protein